MKIFLMLILTFAGFPSGAVNWGFFAHRLINRNAVFSLPPEMIGFYKSHIHLITDNAVNPDKRRYVMEEEGARHYIDIDHYGDSALYKMPIYWHEAVELYSQDTLNQYGIVPWHISHVQHQLTKAFEELDAEKIILISADLGHYISDANVPLHTTENYNGQLTGQYGIHGFWESRLPELFSAEYDLFVGKAEYIDNIPLASWNAVRTAHSAVGTVLREELKLNDQYSSDKKYSHEERGRNLVRVYSREFSQDYHRNLGGMVERRMRSSIKMVADFWYTSWVNAGQPDLRALMENPLKEIEIEKTEQKIEKLARPHEVN